MGDITKDFLACLYSVKNKIATITLNRPKAFNALNSTLLRAIAENVDRAVKDNTVRAIIITGSGKAFCAGADLRDQPIESYGEPTKDGLYIYDRLMSEYKPMIDSIVNSPKLVIGALNGVAAGAGASLALACDLRIMSEEAYLLQAFINIGLVPDAGSTFFLTRQIGYAKALELSVEGKPIPSSLCMELGLTNKVVPADQLINVAQQWAEDLSAKSTFAIGLLKKAMQHGMVKPLSEAFEYEARMQQFARVSDGFTEGVTAFYQKRKPDFVAIASSPHVPRGVFSKL